MRLVARGLAIALLVSAAVIAASFSGKVVGVTDGDTIRVLHGGREERIRLYGVDCPEARQAFGTRAKQYTSSLVFGQTVTVTVKDTDHYGRTVGQITLPDGKNLEQELVRAGIAWWYRQYAKNVPVLPRLEQEARAARCGLWADPKPVPPWEYRSTGRKKVTR